MKQTAFIYMAFGSQLSYKQCAFSLLTLLRTNTTDGNVFVVTDSEESLISLVGLTNKIRYVALTAAQFKTMRGDIDFIHRIKIAVIELIAKNYPDFQRYVYLDSDTLVCNDMGLLIAQVTPDVSLMHTHEIRFSEAESYIDGDQTKTLLNFIRSAQPIRLNTTPIQVDDNFSSWNAGVLGIHARNIQLLDSVYELTSIFYKAASHHASEQFAFSFLLESQTKIQTCQNEVNHYWPKVTKEIADDFFNSFFRRWKKRPADMSFVDESRRELEKLFVTHVYYYQDRAIKAFTSDNFSEGMRWSVKAIVKNPFRRSRFIMDVLYYMKKRLLRLA